MRIAAISAYVPVQRDSQSVHLPRETVTVSLPTPTRLDQAAVLVLSGRGMLLDLVC